MEVVTAGSQAVLRPDSLYSSSAGASTEYCCHQLEEPGKLTNSTFLEVSRAVSETLHFQMSNAQPSASSLSFSLSGEQREWKIL